MKIGEAMTRKVSSIEPTERIADAAHLMGELDLGVLPIEEGGSLIGIVTDRDIAVRGIGSGLHGGSPVLQIMSKDVISCREDDDVEDVLTTMGEQQIRRVPVCSKNGRLIGIFTLCDAAKVHLGGQEIAASLTDISRPHGLHSQLLSKAG